MVRCNKEVTVADIIFKPVSKEPELDDISIITTASSKKGIAEEKQEQNRDIDIITNNNLIDLLKEDSDLAKNRNPTKLVQMDPLVGLTDDEKSDSDTETVSCIEEPLSRLIPEQYTRKPKTSYIETVESKCEIKLDSLPARSETLKGINIHSQKFLFSNRLKQPSLCKSSEESSKGKKSKPLSVTKNMHVIQNNLSIKIDEITDSQSKQEKLKPKFSMMHRDKSQSSFEPANIDEHIQNRVPTYTPRTMVDNYTKLFAKPVNKKPAQKQEFIDEVENDRDDYDNEEDHKWMETDLAFDGVGEFKNQATKQKDFEQRFKLNFKSCIPKSSSLLRGLVSPPPVKRFELRMTDRVHNTELFSKTVTFSKGPKFYLNGNSLRNNSNNTVINRANNKKEYIPCMLLRSRASTSKVLIYFHGNGEDVNLAFELLSHIRNYLMVNK